MSYFEWDDEKRVGEERAQDIALVEIQHGVRKEMSTVQERVIMRLLQRAVAGERKYGTTMDRRDLDVAVWLRHAQEEALDLAVYLEKLITLYDEEVGNKHEPRQLHLDLG